LPSDDDFLISKSLRNKPNLFVSITSLVSTVPSGFINSMIIFLLDEASSFKLLIIPVAFIT
jgi:hypothetical protein